MTEDQPDPAASQPPVLPPQPPIVDGPAFPQQPPAPIEAAVPAEIVTVGLSAKRKVRVPTFLVGLVALALVAGLVGRGLLFGDGGASSPEDAVRQLGTAISNEDLVGALATLAPDEVRDVADTYSTASTKLAALDVTPKQKTLGGIDLNVTGLQLRTTTLGPDVAKVEILGGEFSYRVSEQDLGPKVKQVIQKGDPLGAVSGLDPSDESDRKLKSSSGSASLTRLHYRDDDGVRHPPFLIAVNRDGGWYVSPFYTVAELVVGLTGSRKGDFSAIQPGPAAGSPTGAVDQMIAAINHRDVDAGIDSLSADEWSVLRTYRAAIHAAVDKSTKNSSPESFQIDNDKLTSQPVNDQTAKVFIQSMSGHVVTTKVSEADQSAYDDAVDAADDPDSVPAPKGTKERIKWSYADGCLKVDDTDDPYNSCSTKNMRPGMGIDLGGGFPSDGVSIDNEMVNGLDGSNLFAGAQGDTSARPYIVVVAERGGWAVSPVATLMTYLKTALDHLDANTLARLTGSELDTAPSATLTAGHPVQLKMNSGGFATVAYRATAGVPFHLDVNGESAYGITYRLPDGSESTLGLTAGIAFAPVDGTYRLAITGQANHSVSVDLETLTDIPTLTLGQSATVHLTQTDQQLPVRITLQAGQQIWPTTSDGGNIEVFTTLGRGIYDDTLSTKQASATYYGIVSAVPAGEAGISGLEGLDPVEGSSDDPVKYPIDVTVTAGDGATMVAFDGSGPSVTTQLEASGATPDPDGDDESTDDEYLEVPAGVAAQVHLTTDPQLQARLSVDCYPVDSDGDDADSDFDDGDGDGSTTWIGGTAPGQPADAEIAAATGRQECDVMVQPTAGSGNATLTATH